MLKAALTGILHRGAVLVAGIDDLEVPDAAAGLDDGRNAFLEADLDAVAHREEGVRDHDAARQPALERRYFLDDGAFLAFVGGDVEGLAVALEVEPVLELQVGLVAGDVRHADPVLLPGAD